MKSQKDVLEKIYKSLLKTYGPQGWWPILSLHGKKEGTNPTKAGSINGYHVEDYSFPKNKQQQFEICVGAILTQNTSWPLVEKALINLEKAKLLTPQAIHKVDVEKIKPLIRPAGYFNQKANYLKNFTEFFISLKPSQIPTRLEVLNVKGVGNETADSILLFAFKQPEFIVDAYTKRIFSRIGLIKQDATYLEVKEFFENALEKDIIIYQEYHALIVEHAKQHCTTKQKCKKCPISSFCQKKHL